MFLDELLVLLNFLFIKLFCQNKKKVTDFTCLDRFQSCDYEIEYHCWHYAQVEGQSKLYKLIKIKKLLFNTNLFYFILQEKLML